MKLNKNIQITFMCNQNWDKMSPTSKGRYCDICKKEVIDYTKKSFKDFKIERKQTEGHLCGHFRADQIDSTLIKPIEVSSNVRFFAFFSALLFSITAKTLYSQTNNTITEQYENKNKLDLDYRPPSIEDEEKMQDERIKKEVGDKKPFYTTATKRYYWTKKFPFIKKITYKCYHHSTFTGRFL